MTFVKLEHFNLRQSSYMLIDRVNLIINEFAAEGFTPTLRQIYYQLVQANIIPNKQESYDNLGVLIKKGRLMGLISWDAMQDRIRQIKPWLIEPSQLAVLNGLERNLALDLWTPQETYIEVWVEKDAQVEAVERACRKYRVPYMQCRGYMSWSEIWEAGNRFLWANECGKRTVLIHLGDHDPSGWDMTRDNKKRLEMVTGFELEVQRIALNIEQVRDMKLPAQWAKVTDKRWQSYADEFGPESWELDALRPKFIIGLIEKAIDELIVDRELWDATLAEEKELRKPLKALHGRWNDVKRMFDNPGLIKPEFWYKD